VSGCNFEKHCIFSWQLCEDGYACPLRWGKTDESTRNANIEKLFEYEGMFPTLEVTEYWHLLDGDEADFERCRALDQWRQKQRRMDAFDRAAARREWL